MNGPATDGGARPAYLIVLRHVVVAQDIAATIADVDPGAPVLAVASSEAALPALGEVERLAVAFVAEAPRSFEGSPLARGIAARGGRVVLIGEAAEAEGAGLGFQVLSRPFSTEDLVRHLAATGA